MDVGKILEPIKKFFREDAGEIIGAYFDGDKIFISHLTEKFETIEVEADGSEIERLAEKISQICVQKGWKTSSVGFCLRQEEAVTFQTEISNVPEKEIPALVKSWAMAQAGAEAIFSFAKIGEELWMETLPQSTAKEFSDTFKKFGLNLRGLSVMPAEPLTKIHPYERTEFITEIIREKKSPNLLATRGDGFNWQKISQAVAAIFFIALIVGSVKLFLEYREVSDKLDAAKISVENLNEDIALKKILDGNISELHRINKLAAQVAKPENFNRLLNLGKIADKNIRLTKIVAEENFLEIEGATDESETLKNYLGDVKNFVANSARLESSAEHDGEIFFVIRAALK